MLWLVFRAFERNERARHASVHRGNSECVDGGEICRIARANKGRIRAAIGNETLVFFDERCRHRCARISLHDFFKGALKDRAFLGVGQTAVCLLGFSVCYHRQPQASAAGCCSGDHGWRVKHLLLRPRLFGQPRGRGTLQQIKNQETGAVLLATALDASFFVPKHVHAKA